MATACHPCHLISQTQSKERPQESLEDVFVIEYESGVLRKGFAVLRGRLGKSTGPLGRKQVAPSGTWDT